MKIVAAVFADFEQTFLGGPSQLCAPLHGRTVLARTLGRLTSVTGLAGRCLYVQPRDEAAAKAAVEDLALAGAVDVLPLDDGVRRRLNLLRSARKWNLQAWRGSPLGTTWFDEYVEPVRVARVLERYGCDAVLCLDGHQPLLDVAVADGMLARQRDCRDEAELVFTQAAPGLAGVSLSREIVQRLLEQDIPLGILLAYRPELARGDLINQPACFQVDAALAQTPGRFTADTRRSRELLAAALAELGDEPDTVDLCAWFSRLANGPAGRLPLEVELELTTDDPLPDTTLRPRGTRVPARCLRDLDAVTRLGEQLAEYDDRLVVLGGHGDPLAHPEFAEVCRRLRSAGVCGLAVVTPMVELSDENLEALLTSRVDMLQVRVDAGTPETYQTLHGRDCLERVLANLARIEEQRRARLSPQPIIACSLTRCAATLAELETFYDRWIPATGWAVIEGYNDYCGALPPDTLLPTKPALREGCRRLGARLMLLADGRVVLCHQDFRGAHELGRWDAHLLEDLWSGGNLAGVREAHAELKLAGLPLCGRCGEWFRP